MVMKIKDYTIRKLEKRDNEQLASIMRSVLKEFNAAKPGTVYYDPTTDDLYSLFQHEKSVYFVAERHGELLGGSGIYPTVGLPEGCCELVKLYLLSSARGMGLGKELMQRCFDEARKFGYTSMYLETLPELNLAVGLYEKMGFTYLPGPLGSSGHFGCDLWMLKQL